VRISTEELALNRPQAKSIDPKIQKLINSLADKPLLLEKIIANQQGISLLLGKGSQKLQLQLPPNLARTLSQLTQQQPQLSLSVSKQQVILTINPQMKRLTELTNNRKNPLSTNSELSKQPLNEANSNQNNLIKQTLIFRQAQLISQNPISLALSQVSYNQAGQTQAKTNSDAAVPSEALATNQIGTRQALLDLANPSNLSTNLQKTHSSVDIAGLAKSLIQPNYTAPKNIASQLERIIQRVALLENQSNSPSLTKALQPIKSLLQQLNIGDQLSVSDLKQRISNSGLFFESNAQNKPSGTRPLDLDRIAQLVNQPLKSLKITQRQARLSHSETGSASKSDSHLPISDGQLPRNKIDSQLLPISDSPNKTLPISDSQNKAQDQQSILNRSSERSSHSPSANENKDLKLQLVKIIQSLQKLIESSSIPSAGKKTLETSPSTSGNTDNHHLNLTNTSQPQDNESRESLTDPLIKAQLKAQLNEAISNPKASTLPLNQLVQNQLKDLLSEVKTILSQIETHQLMSIKNEQTGIQQFIFDLPMIKNGQIDSFEMRFEDQNQSASKSDSQYWKVVVRFDLEPLGPMFAQVELKEDRLSTHIFAQSAETAQLIDSHLHVLRDSLVSAGINTDTLAANQGHVPETLVPKQRQGVDLII